MILPGALTTLPGMVIESEYRPALEVSGDFFQIIPYPTDGSLLIVDGDVAGKGLKAGMLVALLVGANPQHHGAEPRPAVHPAGAESAADWARGEALATCLALRVAADGESVLANAGHMPLYLNGEPMAMEGALPLGMIDGAEFSVMRFKPAQHDRLVLVSDGIAEAASSGYTNCCGRRAPLVRWPTPRRASGRRMTSA